MNFSQRLGLFILILISVVYVYFSFFGKDFKMPEFGNNNKTEERTNYNPLEPQEPEETANTDNNQGIKSVKIFVIDKTGELRPLHRECDTAIEKSCFEYAVRQLISGPTKWEKSKGFMSEIPAGTKLLSVRESAGAVMIDLSSEFETGGGAESTYMRVKQIIKTANSNTNTPTYLYVNGRQANVIGGEGIMVKQPLNERSLDE